MISLINLFYAVVTFDRNYDTCYLSEVKSFPNTPVKKKPSLSDVPTYFIKPCSPQFEELSVPTITISTIPNTSSPTSNIPSSLNDINYISPHSTKNNDFLQMKQLSNTLQPLHDDSEISVSVSLLTEQHSNTSQHPHHDTGISVSGSFSTEQNSNTCQLPRDDSGISVGSFSTVRPSHTSQRPRDDSGISVVGSFSTELPSIVSKHIYDDIGLSVSGSLSTEQHSKTSQCSHDDFKISANTSFSKELPSIVSKHTCDDNEIFTGEYIIITV